MFRTNRLIRYINQNRRRILFVIGAIAGLIIVIQLLNSFAKKQLSSSSIAEETNSNTESLYKPNETIITNTTVGDAQAQENSQIIDKFVEYCNNQELEKAYELLTDECKEVLYPTVEKFYSNYYSKVFNNKKTYNIQSWMTRGDNYIYKVRFLEDILATGKYNSEALEDYITIVDNDKQIKLNINSYIGRQNINKDQENQGIKINIIYKDIHKSYEEYSIKVTNNTNEDILLDSLETVNGIKLVGESNEVEYQAFINELSSYDVKVPSENTKTIRIKFSKEYNPAREVNSIQFFDIILNEEKYIENKEDESNKTGIEVKFK